MAIATTSILAIFFFAYIGFTNESLYTIAHGTVNMLVISFFHLLLLVQAAKYANHFFRLKRRFYRYILTYIVTVAYSFCISPVRIFFADSDWRIITFQQQMITIFAGSLVLDAIIIAVHNLVIMYRLNADAEIENEQLKAANSEAHNLLLRQQIHPHFLFNALNILKALYKKDPSSGDEYIVHLANFLRAAISNTSAKLVTPADEAALCNDYIVMQKIRFGDALQCYIDPALSQNRQDHIPSFSLQPLLENAIKHNEVSDAAPLTIRVFERNGYVVVESNLQKKKQPAASTGNGLQNLQKRYELISGDPVIITEANGIFSVQLKILKA